MLKTIIKWILYFFIASILVFCITRLIPISPVKMYLSAYMLPDTLENVAWLTEKWGLDAPLFSQYFTWIKNFILGDWGTSLMTNQPIAKELLHRLPLSMTISLGGLFIGMIFSFFFGYLSAIFGGIWDLFTRGITILSQVVPIFISAILVIQLLGVKYHVIQFFTGDQMASLITATLLFSIYCMGDLVRIVRVHFLELMQQPYIIRLYTAGFSKHYVLLRHGFKPVIHGINGALISKFAGVMGGATVTEFAFAIPGISYFLIQNIAQRDYMVIQSYLLVVILWMMGIHGLFSLIDYRLDYRRKA